MITLIIGTNHPGSNTRKIAAHLEEIYAESRVPLRTLDLGQRPLFSLHCSKEVYPDSCWHRYEMECVV
jgi:NAD(P)H-dependent FMN reductase